MLAFLPQLVVSGIATGMLYALMALSMTVGYRATTVVNFGHGDMLMIGAYASYVLVVGIGLPFGPAFVLAAALLFFLGVAAQRLLMQPIIAGPHLSLAMMALAVGYALRGLARIEWGNTVLKLPRAYPSGTFMLGPVVVTTDDLVISAAVLVLLSLLFLVFNLTAIGRVIQAVFQTQRGA